jgi:hypothetical protein
VRWLRVVDDRHRDGAVGRRVHRVSGPVFGEGILDAEVVQFADQTCERRRVGWARISGAAIVWWSSVPLATEVGRSMEVPRPHTREVTRHPDRSGPDACNR